jgi:hypothetical protein
VWCCDANESLASNVTDYVLSCTASYSYTSNMYSMAGIYYGI